jgi:hypothetical protein
MPLPGPQEPPPLAAYESVAASYAQRISLLDDLGIVHMADLLDDVCFAREENSHQRKDCFIIGPKQRRGS